MRKKYGVIIGVVGLILFLCMEAWSTDWKLFFTTKDGDTYYYEPESITHPSKDIVRVWTKDILSEEKIVPGRDEVYYRYKKTLFEFLCVEREYRISSSVYYSQDDRVLSSVKPFKSVWDTFPPEMQQALTEAYQQKNRKRWDAIMDTWTKEKMKQSINPPQEKSRTTQQIVRGSLPEFIVPDSSVEKLYKIVCSNPK